MVKKKIVVEDGKTYVMTEKKPIYKRAWFWFLTVIAVVIVSGVLGNQEETADDGEKSDTPKSEANISETKKTKSKNKRTSEPAPHQVGETGELEGASFEVLSAEFHNELTDDNNFGVFTPSNGTYLVVEVHIVNTGEKALSYNNGNFKVLKGSSEYKPTTLLGIGKEYFDFENLNPGLDSTGKIVFEVPVDIDLSDVTLRYEGDFISIPEGKIEFKLN